MKFTKNDKTKIVRYIICKVGAPQFMNSAMTYLKFAHGSTDSQLDYQNYKKIE